MLLLSVVSGVTRTTDKLLIRTGEKKNHSELTEWRHRLCATENETIWALKDVNVALSQLKLGSWRGAPGRSFRNQWTESLNCEVMSEVNYSCSETENCCLTICKLQSFEIKTKIYRKRCNDSIKRNLCVWQTLLTFTCKLRPYGVSRWVIALNMSERAYYRKQKALKCCCAFIQNVNRSSDVKQQADFFQS